MSAPANSRLFRLPRIALLILFAAGYGLSQTTPVGLRYKLATGDQPFPLIVYLSGGGGLAFDAALTAGDAIEHSGYLALYPHAAGGMWWERKPTAIMHALLLEVLRDYNVDTNRVYLAGFSNGGTGALELKRDCQLFAQSAETYADPFLAYTAEVVLDVPE